MYTNTSEAVRLTGETKKLAEEAKKSGIKKVHRLSLVYNDLTSACSCQCVTNCSCDCDRKAL